MKALVYLVIVYGVLAIGHAIAWILNRFLGD